MAVPGSGSPVPQEQARQMDSTKRVCAQVEVTRVTTIQQLVDHSSAARSTGSTGANADSSRSHSIMQARMS